MWLTNPWALGLTTIIFMFPTIRTGIGGVDHVHVQEGGPHKTRQNNYRQTRNYLPVAQRIELTCANVVDESLGARVDYDHIHVPNHPDRDWRSRSRSRPRRRPPQNSSK